MLSEPLPKLAEQAMASLNLFCVSICVLVNLLRRIGIDCTGMLRADTCIRQLLLGDHHTLHNRRYAHTPLQYLHQKAYGVPTRAAPFVSGIFFSMPSQLFPVSFSALRSLPVIEVFRSARRRQMHPDTSVRELRIALLCNTNSMTLIISTHTRTALVTYQRCNPHFAIYYYNISQSGGCFQGRILRSGLCP